MMIRDNCIQNVVKKNSRMRLDMTKSYKSRYRKHIIKRKGTYCSKLKFDLEPGDEQEHSLKPKASLSMVIEWLRSENFNVENYQQGLYVLNDKVLTPASILIFANNLRLKKKLDIFKVE